VNSKNETILIVDDSPDNLIVMKKVLEKALPHVTVLTCQNPEKAQALLQETEVALAVLDVQMPKIDGLELCKRIKNDTATPFVSVILITSHVSDPRMRAKGLALGADDFITRPMDNAELCARVKVALRVHRTDSALRDTAGRAEAEVAQLGLVLEESLNEILIFDAQTLHFVNVNKAVRENTGYSMEELRGMTPLDLGRDLTSEFFAELVRPLREGIKKRIQFETTRFRKDGSNFPVEVSLQLMTGDHPVFGSISDDITKRKQMEARLRQSEKMDSIDQMVFITRTRMNRSSKRIGPAGSS
jgi:PAS domain S-box-containing protein